MKSGCFANSGFVSIDGTSVKCGEKCNAMQNKIVFCDYCQGYNDGIEDSQSHGKVTK